MTNLLLILALNVTAPCGDTPLLNTWVSWQREFGATTWGIQETRTLGFCREVTFTFASRSNKLYTVDMSGDLRTWRRVSSSEQMYYLGTGQPVTVRLGWPYRESFVRCQEW